MSHNAVAVTLEDGRVLVAGGEQATCGAGGCGGGTYVAVESAVLYDPATDTWLPLPPMPEPRAGGTPVVLADGSVLIAAITSCTNTSNPSVMLAAGLLVMFLFYTGWGMWEILTLPTGKLP